LAIQKRFPAQRDSRAPAAAREALAVAQDLEALQAELASARAELAELSDTRVRLSEAEDALRAILDGEVDAVVVENSSTAARVFSVSSADRPYRIFVENMQEGAATLSSTGIVLFANQRLADLIDYPVMDIVARKMIDFVAESSRADLIASTQADLVSSTMELSLTRRDESVLEALVGVSRLDVDGERLTCLTFTDLTAEHTLLGEVRASEERYRTIVENAQEGISLLDADGVFTFANRRTADLLGYVPGTLSGVNASAILGPTRQTAMGTPDTAQYEINTVRPDGGTMCLLVSKAPILLPGSGAAGSLCMLSDVSGLRHAEEELAFWALHDPLTGLPNRTLLVDRIAHALTRASRRIVSVATLFCDIDGFKNVNDSYGHTVGDAVLQTVARRLGAAVRPEDTVARMGGDEFVVLCEDMVDETQAFAMASRVLDSIQQPIDVEDRLVTVSASVGVAFASSGDPAELLRNADAAMYLAKERGRNRAELFNERLRQVAADRIRLIADLRHSVPRGELRVHYQPIFRLEGEQLLGVEALVRWEHPTRGLLPPDEFIPAAESASLIGEIGSEVLKTACRQAAAWAKAGPGRTPLHMAVNVSARQLAQGSDLVALVADALEDAQIDPAGLVLEVTESAIMDDAEATLTILTELKRLGVRLAIDDFGTGYSSLVYLKRFPVDQLKVDRAFVSGLGSNSDDSAIVASVVSLARAVGINAVAEGVETREQLSALQRLECSFGQGYLWSPARPAAELDAMIRSGMFSDPRRTTPSARGGAARS
jgi:diguanylate cyclase (GGDEF)-like protein/PAS domain S-box-containing protein